MWVSPAHDMPGALAATTPATQVADVVACAVRRHRRRPDRLLQILRDVQDELHWLSDNTLQRVADALGISCAQAQALASCQRQGQGEAQGREHGGAAHRVHSSALR
jgi:NADH:ubiquinone oxidoreductase subunit E